MMIERDDSEGRGSTAFAVSGSRFIFAPAQRDEFAGWSPGAVSVRRLLLATLYGQQTRDR